MLRWIIFIMGLGNFGWVVQNIENNHLWWGTYFCLATGVLALVAWGVLDD